MKLLEHRTAPWPYPDGIEGACPECGGAGRYREQLHGDRFPEVMPCPRCRVYCPACKKHVPKTGHRCLRSFMKPEEADVWTDVVSSSLAAAALKAEMDDEKVQDRVVTRAVEIADRVLWRYRQRAESPTATQKSGSAQ